ncbi:MAG: hypothetical protein WDN07_04980 [Actinomycetota bacterium]
MNTSAGKNLVGSFYSPREVCADITWLESLSDRDFSAGLAEVIKTGFISDLSILELLESVSGVKEARTLAKELVATSVAVKAYVVSADFTRGNLSRDFLHSISVIPLAMPLKKWPTIHCGMVKQFRLGCALLRY